MACLLGLGVLVLPLGWLCVSAGWHIVGGGLLCFGMFVGIAGVSVCRMLVGLAMCAWWLAHKPVRIGECRYVPVAAGALTGGWAPVSRDNRRAVVWKGASA